MEEKKVTVGGIEYEVALERFDEDIDAELGAVYHGFYVRIPKLDIVARKYDDEEKLNVLQWPHDEAEQALAALRGVAKELFQTDAVELLEI